MEYNFNIPVSDDRVINISLYMKYYYPAYFAAYTFTGEKEISEKIAISSIEYLRDSIRYTESSQLLEQKLSAFIKSESLKYMIDHVISSQEPYKS